MRTADRYGLTASEPVVDLQAVMAHVRSVVLDVYAEESPEALRADALQREHDGQRDVALYVRDPHVVLSRAPHALFLDPSHTFRLNLEANDLGIPIKNGVEIREAHADDQTAVNTIYLNEPASWAGVTWP